jgi:hypothetical protein
MGLPRALRRDPQDPPPPPFPQQHATQSQTAACTTELLQGRAGGLGERLVTARPLAKRIFSLIRVGIALAIADRTGFRLLPLADSLPVAASLSPSAAPALFAASITAVGGPLSPAARGRSAFRTAVSAKRMTRLEDPLTALQKTDAAARTRRGALHESRTAATLRWAQGELLLPAGQVSLRSAYFAARRFYSSPLFRWRQPSPQDSRRPAALPRSTLRGLRQPHRQNGPATDRHRQTQRNQTE